MTMCRVMESEEGLVQVKVLDNGHLCWSHLQLSDKTIQVSAYVTSIPAEDILQVRIKAQKRKLPETQSPSTSADLRTHVLVVHYVIRKEKQRLRMGSCKLFGTNTECQSLANDINNKRPGCGAQEHERRLLVLINPISGKNKGPTLYRERVEPLFKACEINTDIIVTARAGQMSQIMQEHDLQSYDGIVVFGGDGSCNEVICGLLTRGMTEAKRDVNDFKADVVPMSIPVGFVPTGSGNWLAWHLNGTRDVVTAAIHIIRGNTVQMSTASVHDPDGLLGFCSVVHHIGFVGDLIRQSELNRWLGPARYTVTSHTALLKRRLLSAQMMLYLGNDNDVMVQPGVGGFSKEASERERERSDVSEATTEDSERKKERSNVTGCSRDLQKEESFNVNGSSRVSPKEKPERSYNINELSTKDPNLIVTSDTAKFSWDDKKNTEILNVDAYNVYIDVSRALTKDRTLKVRLGNDTVCLQIAKKCTLPEFIKYLVKVKDNAPGMVDFSYVECRKIRAMKLTLTNKESREQTWFLNNDGESVAHKADAYYFRLHPRVLRAFGCHEA